ncbi:hypothetical protein PUN4_460010 [Paraburkholderia unamae]|nr:hypothetical protein PUN4_460010 [Paraburkholderia unamae]
MRTNQASRTIAKARRGSVVETPVAHAAPHLAICSRERGHLQVCFSIAVADFGQPVGSLTLKFLRAGAHVVSGPPHRAT